MENTKPNGIHNLLELKGCDPQQINNLKKIKEILVGSANISDIKILSKKFKKFKPHGLTGFLLLSASHISIHTWPEFNAELTSQSHKRKTCGVK
jgi:S-adenosylmethionine decarboxylase